ncbi:S26 family signal peptidase [Campylobacter concisus]|uniref:S26 family signal peptidase n=1 Tax=Campylobacter concisus TaxID=199 RepID=UPI000CD8EE3E|nr:S26 family signal peptidase [Campylobacter concisus]
MSIKKGLEETLNNKDTSEMASSKSNLDTPDCQNVFIWKLEKDTFFMVGDNRNHSFDSSFFGVIPYKFLVGKVKWQVF